MKNWTPEPTTTIRFAMTLMTTMMTRRLINKRCQPLVLLPIVKGNGVQASGDWHNHWRLAFYVGPPQNHQFNEWNDLNFHIFKNYNQPCHNDHPSTLLHQGVYEANDLSGGKSGTNLGHKSLPSLTEKTVAIIVYQSSLSSSRHHDHQDHQDHHDRHDGHDHHHHIIIVILTASRCPPWLKKTVLSAFHSHHHRRRGFRDWEWEHNTLKYLRPGGGLSRTVPWCPPGGRFWHSDHQ